MYKRLVAYGVAALLGVATAVALGAVFTLMTVKGTAMEPTLVEGNRVLINKLESQFEVGDVIAFRSEVYGEEGEGSVLVRRVAGSEGDVVEIKDNVFYLNNRPYYEYMKEAVHMDDVEAMRLGDGEYFVLGDNRRSSMDSRNEAIGVLDSEDCIGKVCFE